MLGATYRQTAARAMFGGQRSSLSPATLWIGWWNTTGVELTTTRVPVANTSATFGPAGDGVSNITPLDGGTATAAWILGGVALYDAATGGNLVISATLDTPLTVAADDPITIPVGGLVLEVV